MAIKVIPGIFQFFASLRHQAGYFESLSSIRVRAVLVSFKALQNKKRPANAFKDNMTNVQNI
jgi:hypothetical protein